MEDVQTTLDNILLKLERNEVLIRTNNLLISRFILELNSIRKSMNLPKSNIYFKFVLTNEEYNSLVDEFGQVVVDKAMYKLDRLLLTNKQQCPNNIAQYVRKKLRKNGKSKEQ